MEETHSKLLLGYVRCQPSQAAVRGPEGEGLEEGHVHKRQPEEQGESQC